MMKPSILHATSLMVARLRDLLQQHKSAGAIKTKGGAVGGWNGGASNHSTPPDTENRFHRKRKSCRRTRRLRGEGAASVLRGARQRSTQALDATLSRLVNAAPPLLDCKGYKVVLVR